MRCMNVTIPRSTPGRLGDQPISLKYSPPLVLGRYKGGGGGNISSILVDGDTTAVLGAELRLIQPVPAQVRVWSPRPQVALQSPQQRVRAVTRMNIIVSGRAWPYHHSLAAYRYIGAYRSSVENDNNFLEHRF